MAGLSSIPRPRLPRSRRKWEEEVQEELRFHLEMRMEDLVAAGLSIQEARRAAEKQFGNVEAIAAECVRVQTQHPVRVVGQVLQTVLFLTLTFGAVGAAFLLVNAALFRVPVPFHDTATRATVWWHHAASDQWTSDSSMRDFLAWRNLSDLIEHISIARYQSVHIQGEAWTEAGLVKRVSGNYFYMFGAEPVLGRVFDPSEEEATAQTVTVISEGLWERRFDRSREVLGKKILINGDAHTIVGVIPASVPMYYDTALFTPLHISGEETDHERLYLTSMRLREGVTRAEAEGALAQHSLFEESDTSPDYAGWQVSLRSINEVYASPVRAPLLGVLSLVSLLLLLAVVHGLQHQVTEAKERWTERFEAAGGALSMRQVRIESHLEGLLVAGLALLLALPLARLGAEVLATPLMGDFERLFDARTDARVMVFLGGMALVVGLMFGLAPWMIRPRNDRLQAVWSMRRFRLAAGLVSMEVAVAFVLLLLASVPLHLSVRGWMAGVGYNPMNLFTISIPATSFEDPADRHRFFGALFEEVEAVPGVAGASFTHAFPMTGSYWEPTFKIVGREASMGDESVHFSVVGTDYLHVMELPVIQGRGFEASDHSRAPHVVVINQAMAERYWPGQNPVGAQMVFKEDTHPKTVIGVVGNIPPHGPHHEVEPIVYRSYWQFGGPATMTLVVRAAKEVSAVAGSVQRTLQQLNPTIPYGETISAEAHINQSTSFVRLIGGLTGLLALLALAVASVGLSRLVAIPTDPKPNTLRLSLVVILSGLVLGGFGAWGVSHIHFPLISMTTHLEPSHVVGSALCMGVVWGVVVWRRVLVSQPA